MTTIAWDGETLAADGRVTAGGDIVSDNEKKIHVCDGADWRIEGHKIIAFANAGNPGFYYEIIRALESGLRYGNKFSKSGYQGAVLLTDNKKIFNFTKMDESEECKLNIISSGDQSFAIGSGCYFALAAMKLGKSAIEAVEFAATIDTCSGGVVTFISYDELIK
jgi:ATP-dependent protease HslVU (ClpYQ) peptidase subunit